MILMLAFLGTFQLTGQPPLEKLRSLLEVASTNEQANKDLLALTKSATLKENTVYYAYHAAALTTMANHVFWPTEKLDYFNEGKEKLEKAVNFDLQNVEIRFVRYSVQAGSPSIVGYKSNMSEDKKFILAHLSDFKATEAYKQKIKQFLNKA